MPGQVHGAGRALDDSALLPRSRAWGTTDAEIKVLFLMGAQGHQRFPLSKPGVGQATCLCVLRLLTGLQSANIVSFIQLHQFSQQ